MKTYTIKRMPEGAGLPALNGALTGAWAECPAAAIDQYTWDVNGYRPAAEARVMYSEAGLYVYMRAEESEIRAKADMCGTICQDSCLEFFLQPNAAVPRYTNVEMNPLGKYMCGIGRDRYDRFEAKTLPFKGMEVRHSVKTAAGFAGPCWEIAYLLPADWLQLWFGWQPACGLRMRGNFYKCGDMTRFEHYGMWNPVVSERPDFHIPEYFGELILE